MKLRTLLRPALVLCSMAALAAWVAQAQIVLPKLIADHAVLQREQPIHVWGYATPGARIAAQFHAQTQAAVADTLGRWSLYLAPEHAGGPFALHLSGDGPEVTVSDLLVGDVWFASGQSNMEIPLNGFPPVAHIKNAEAEIAAAANPNLRLLLVAHKSSDFPLDDVQGTWQTCTPETARHFSAIAYFFGREIAADQKVPIGLIDSAWGGTPADSWVSLDTLGTDPALLPAFRSRAAFVREQALVPRKLAAEQAEDAAAKAAGRPVPIHPWHPDETSWSPAALFNGMVAPVTPLSIKGILWDQGETNSGKGRAPEYGRLFAALIGDWRMQFAQGPLPFLYVQISSYSSPGEDWGLVRDGQRRALAVAHTAMAVTLDVGQPDNVHPPDKQTVAARLAAAARATVYGEPVPYSGPAFRQVTTRLESDGSTALEVWFDHGAGLTWRGHAANGFEVAGEDHVFVPAQARILPGVPTGRPAGDTVLLTAPAVAHPVYVRYGWASVVDDNLFNAAGFPTSTFSSEPMPR